MLSRACEGGQKHVVTKNFAPGSCPIHMCSFHDLGHRCSTCHRSSPESPLCLKFCCEVCPAEVELSSLGSLDTDWNCEMWSKRHCCIPTAIIPIFKVHNFVSLKPKSAYFSWNCHLTCLSSQSTWEVQWTVLQDSVGFRFGSRSKKDLSSTVRCHFWKYVTQSTKTKLTRLRHLKTERLLKNLNSSDIPLARLLKTKPVWI